MLTRFLMIFVLLSQHSIGLFAVEIPINIGLGPAVIRSLEKLQPDEEDSVYYGLKLDIAAVVDKETIDKNKGKIPKKFQKAAGKLHEVRVSHFSIPDMIFVGGNSDRRKLYGASWRPFALSMSGGGTTIRFGKSLWHKLVLAFFEQKIFDADTAEEETTRNPLLRPGLDLRFQTQLRITRSFYFSMGAGSNFLIPQEVVIQKNPEATRSVWRLDEAYAALHFRFPVTYK